jgi:hypothetical protein
VFTWNNFENSTHFLVFNNNTQQKCTTNRQTISVMD